MAKTVVGLFDNRAEAQDAVRELLGQGFNRDAISVVARRGETEEAEVAYVEEDGHKQVEDMAKGAGTGAAIGGAAGLLLSLTALAIPGIGPVLAAGPLAAIIAGAGVGATAGGALSGFTRLGLNDDDAGTYAEGVRRGGTLVSVDSPDDGADLAVAVMKQHGAVEIDKRAAQWREGGWTGFDAQPASAGHESSRAADVEASRIDGPGGAARRYAPGEVTAEQERPAARVPRAGGDEIAVPVVEERLEVGKREVERGGVRVHSRVTETPVEEQVELRDERVRVDRRDVDYTFHGGESDAFKEAMLEIREAHEELVVNKKARVVEEVIVGKDVEQHTETVRDTLRRTDVEVERLEPEQSRGATASPQGTQADTPGGGLAGGGSGRE